MFAAALVAGAVALYNARAGRLLQRELAHLEERVKTLKQDRNKLEKEKGRLETDVASLKEEEQKLERGRQKLREEKQELDDERIVLAAETEAIQAERQRREAERQTLEEQRRLRANTITNVKVTFDTTEDDKDDQDEVTVTVLKNDDIVTSVAKWKGTKLDNGSAHNLYVALPPNIRFDDSYELSVSESGTDGWIFHATVEGTFADGATIELFPRSGPIQFRDAVQSHPFRLRR